MNIAGWTVFTKRRNESKKGRAYVNVATVSVSRNRRWIDRNAHVGMAAAGAAISVGLIGMAMPVQALAFARL